MLDMRRRGKGREMLAENGCVSFAGESKQTDEKYLMQLLKELLVAERTKGDI